MNNENKELLHNDVEINVSEENIILAPPVELFDEAKEIAQTTVGDEKFPFMLQYDSNQKEFLLSMLRTVGAIVKNDDEEVPVLSTVMNMTQLAFIKRLDCIERVKTDVGEVHNPFFIQEAQPAATTATVASAVSTEIGTVQIEQLETLAVNDGIAVASASAGASNSYGYSNNSTMDTAKVVSDESYTSGYICCPGNEQWFKFVATRTGQYTICTTGSLDTIGTLYDSFGNQIIRVDDYAPCGKINFRIICNLTEGNTYYVRVGISKENVGSYTLRVTERVFAN